jgi:hypothetical protein
MFFRLDFPFNKDYNFRHAETQYKISGSGAGEAAYVESGFFAHVRVDRFIIHQNPE